MDLLGEIDQGTTKVRIFKLHGEGPNKATEIGRKYIDIKIADNRLISLITQEDRLAFYYLIYNERSKVYATQ